MRLTCVEIDGEEYYIDLKLSELRSVLNPNRKRSFEKKWDLLDWLLEEKGEDWFKKFSREEVKIGDL